MTIWMPELRGRTGPKYQAIVDAIVDAVEMGDLTPGTKLPPQRNLAYDLGVTLGTVTRAYQELERSGLARGEVGRGTFGPLPDISSFLPLSGGFVVLACLLYLGLRLPMLLVLLLMAAASGLTYFLT